MPQIVANDFVVLEDDQGMFSADNILPALTTELAGIEGVSGILDALSATLTTENVTAMNARFDIDVEDADVVAADFITENAADACTGRRRPTPLPSSSGPRTSPRARSSPSSTPSASRPPASTPRPRTSAGSATSSWPPSTPATSTWRPSTQPRCSSS